jgi:hypothetical protein
VFKAIRDIHPKEIMGSASEISVRLVRSRFVGFKKDATFLSEFFNEHLNHVINKAALYRGISGSNRLFQKVIKNLQKSMFEKAIKNITQAAMLLNSKEATFDEKIRNCRTVIEELSIDELNSIYKHIQKKELSVRSATEETLMILVVEELGYRISNKRLFHERKFASLVMKLNSKQIVQIAQQRSKGYWCSNENGVEYYLPYPEIAKDLYEIGKHLEICSKDKEACDYFANTLFFAKKTHVNEDNKKFYEEVESAYNRLATSSK